MALDILDNPRGTGHTGQSIQGTGYAEHGHDMGTGHTGQSTGALYMLGNP